MAIFFGFLCFLALIGLRKAERDNYDYMSVNMTNSIKGFFIGLVFISHIWGYTDFSHPYLDVLYQKLIRGKMGQCVVAMFLFYSGFGVMESIKRKGQNYVNRIPVRRVLNVLLQFDCVILLFWLYRISTGTHYGIKKMVLSFIGWDGIGNSNWYIFCILWVYIFTFIAFGVFRDNHKKAIAGVFVLSILYMAIVSKLGKEYWWYDTILCYVWGMLFSLYRDKVERFVNENRRTWLFTLFVCSVGHMITYYYKSNSPLVYQLWVFCFTASIVTFTMRYVIDSKILRGGGIMLFELYMLQRLVMMILKPYMLAGELTSTKKYIYVVACFIGTIVISVLYRKTIGRLIKQKIG